MPQIFSKKKVNRLPLLFFYWVCGVFVIYGFFLLFLRYLPMISMAKVKALLPQADPHHDNGKHYKGTG